MTQPYHKFVFNDGKFAGQFDAMYAAEDMFGFDSWRQADVQHIRLRLTREILSDFNFERVLDLGCGKGHATQFLKRANNQVIGIDASSLAVHKAKASFPDIVFRCCEVQSYLVKPEEYDLISCQGTLGYIKDWRNLLRTIATRCYRCVVSEYVPRNAIGFIKTRHELVDEFDKSFEIERKVLLDDDVVILLGKAR